MASDPEVASNELINGAADELDVFSTKMAIFTDKINRFAKGLRKHIAQIEQANTQNNITRQLKGLKDILNLIDHYKGTLISVVPELDNSLDNSLTKYQRAIEITRLSGGLREAGFSQNLDELNNLKNSFGSLGEEISSTSTAIESWPDSIPELAWSKRKLLALHADLLSLFGRASRTLTSIQNSIEEHPQEDA